MYFGCGAEGAVEVWNALVCFAVLPDEGQILHLLWALYFMKCYPTEETACAAAGGHTGAIDPKTLRKYIWPFIEAIANLEPYVVSVMHYCFDFYLVIFLLKIFQILLENRYKHDQNNDCLLSVDGTDFQIPERGREWYSFKFKKSGVRYEVALSILGGEICWISGPHQPGVYNDLDIF